ncbi:acetyltransferase [Hyphomicrobium nitrativorans NL23]|uniref:Acetyltransferase n=1 Tax=Hyphomicrobium nitrativorans NL23 TaxID=1029756 RepID=V5S986_9HYPH|nr:acetyltransferase [Hyphomicrobium nitrativorans]AHB47198.1 acetyltransferase [Hyphomicrobium nitrativorans NL23]
MTRLFGIYGASGYGREVLPLARAALGLTDSATDELVFVDDGPMPPHVNGHRVLGWNAFQAATATKKYACVAIANSAVREKLATRCVEAGVEFFSVRASNVVELDDVDFGAGAILSPFVTLTSNIRIGKHFHANIYSYVAHDCVIGDFVTFAPAVHCNGNVTIGDHAYIGTGAILRQGRPGAPLTIGAGAVVGMGAVVTKDVPPGATVVGNPARLFLKK